MMADEYDSDPWDGISDQQESPDDSSNGSDNGFFDLEASEASSDGPGEEHLRLHARATAADPFRKFMLLPPEVREMVWKAFCPDLSTAPRVFQLILMSRGDIFLGPTVESQVYPIRTLLSVCKETRALALKYSPHRLELPHGGGIVPCHMERDIILSTSNHTGFLDNPVQLLLDLVHGFQNLAFDLGLSDMLAALSRRVWEMSSLRSIFVFTESHSQPSNALIWCASGRSQEFHLHTEEIEEGLGEDIDMVFCWPDPAKCHPSDDKQFNSQRIGFLGLDGNGAAFLGPDGAPCRSWAWGAGISRLRHALGIASDEDVLSNFSQSDDDNEEQECTSGNQHIRVWPMAVFEFDSEIQRLDKLKSWDRSWDEWESSDSGSPQYSTIEDQYESDGIDDDPIDDFLATDDEDDLPAHLLDGSSQASDQTLGNTFRADELPAAQFSSDSESEDQGDDGSNVSGIDDGEISCKRSSRPAGRRLAVSDSESENDDESATETGTSPPANRRGRVILLDSDDEDEEDGPRPASSAHRRARRIATASENSSSEKEDDERPRPRRARPIPVDSDDDDNGQDEADADKAAASSPKSRPAHRRARARALAATLIDSEEEDGSSSNESSGSESEEEAPAQKRMSLAKRLQLEHRRARAALPTAEDSDGADTDGYGKVSDDEDDDGASDDAGEMVMGLAEEGDEDEREDDEEGW